MPHQSELPILTALKRGEIIMQGQFLRGSNYAFLGWVNHEGIHLPIVYKPIRGELPLWDFPAHTLAKRETATYVVNSHLNWELVPPTVFRKKNLPAGPGSLQLYIDHDPNINYFTLDENHRQRLKDVVLLDLLINNADRKGGHILLDSQDHIWLIDHGLCFHTDYKLRTVIWDFAGELIPDDLLNDMSHLIPFLDNVESDLFKELLQLISPAEIRALKRRAMDLVDFARFPYPEKNHHAYPFPPV